MYVCLSTYDLLLSPDIKGLTEKLLLLSHGKASIERGFSVLQRIASQTNPALRKKLCLIDNPIVTTASYAITKFELRWGKYIGQKRKK